ncbi:Uncharacterized conserved protein, DUF2141 family [Chryseolinea serpens]|uniref:Uncharacterized conserved protein, DUF2141 family n=1 Tax=Chryseolinea serpens TaxID=947013 RepID=A0A1M5R983_9BACT|nr:DUF2141 domain-containing protein [Chryseolinea serpens]SHH22576.1 Uncharacterized conserved protein, DUF2141 family [Chryseolinea serpens]
MRRTIMIALVLSFVTMAMAQNKLEVKVGKIKSNKGNIIVGLYDKDDHFPRNAMEGKIVRASKDGVIVVFDNVKPGRYAVSVLHDENKNKDLDQNRLGIPKEGFGFSNNAMGAIGPPSFEKASIELPVNQKDTNIVIDMRYMLGKNKTD